MRATILLLFTTMTAAAVIGAAVWPDHGATFPLWRGAAAVAAVTIASAAVTILLRGIATRTDLAPIRADQIRQRHFNEVLWSRQVRSDHAIRLLIVEPALERLDEELAAASIPLDRFADPEAHLPRWREAATRWMTTAAEITPAIASIVQPATRADLLTARTRLPPRLNLSSPDLRAATDYVVERDQLQHARELHALRRTAIIDSYRTVHE